MNNPVHLASALVKLAYTVKAEVTDNVVTSIKATRNGSTMTFFRNGADDAFQTFSKGDISAVGRKYAEEGTRAWAKKNGYTIQSNDGRDMVLVNRSK